ncbi:MAG: tetratricopeptide repeat protein, partial [Hyphomicrobiales bacterium]|nr:tetratricopeptide repeat protein [Hyphomicrobiales bacterium]
GQLQKAEQLCRKMLGEQDDNPGYGYVKMALGAILLETNRLDEAEKLLKQTIELGYLSADYTFSIHCLITLAQLHQHQTHLAKASACLEQAQRLMQQTQAHFGAYHYDYAQVQQWCLEKNISALQQWLIKHPADASPVNYQLLHAKGLIATEQFRPAIRILENAELPTEHIEIRIQAQCLLAIAYKRVRDDERCFKAIASALTLSEAVGFQRIFCVFNHTMLQILKDTLANYAGTHSFSVEYLGQLIKLLQGSMQVKQALENPLTNREITVLRFMSAGLTNRAIADELVISIGTVKGYSRNIYSKLAVSNRQDAVQKAFDLNLI